MRILFLCGSDRSYEASQMTCGNICGSRAIRVSQDQVLSELLGEEDIVILDEVWRIPDQMYNWRWITRERGRLLEMSERGIVYPQMELAHIDSEMCTALSEVLAREVLHLPDIYEKCEKCEMEGPLEVEEEKTLNVCSLGYGSRWSNTMAQAVAAVMLGKRLGVEVCFHYTRGEESVVEGVRELFAGRMDASCVIHGEMSRADRCRLISMMDIGLQVGMIPEKTIVSDYVSMGIPVLTGESEEWLPVFTADPESPSDICEKAERALKFGFIGKPLSKLFLRSDVSSAKKKWVSL